MDNVLIAIKNGYYISDDLSIIGKRVNSLKLRINSVGYFIFRFRVKGKIITILYHRMVAYKKFGDRLFEDGIVVRHINGNRLDNSWNNIEIGTESENMMDKPKYIRQYFAKMANKKHSDELIKSVREERLNGKTYEQLKLQFGLCKSTLSYYLGKNCKKSQVCIEDSIQGF